MTILLTSFAPWLCHHCSNSSDDLLVSIQDNYAKKLLFLRQRVIKAIQDKKPDFVICCGMAESRYRLSLESQARSSTKKLFTPIPLKDFVKELAYTYISDNAGQFVCEELYFQVLKHHPRALFVHVPLLTDKNFAIIQRDFQKIITLSR
ncbi:MAG: peptidase C15 [Microcystis aeruginosa Ma_QC_Ch_20071001_M135]|nr:MAG: peptidase C15 [Microcystis aeruginosa Ma_QC_Ch_20071001_M135]